MKHKTSLICATLFTATAFAAPAMADSYRDNSGLFIGGSYGGFKAHGGDFKDDNDLISARLGYQFNEFFALDAEYLDFGKFGKSEDVRSKLKAFALGARGRLPVTDSFGVYAKAGAFVYSFDVDAFDDSKTYDKVSPFFGAGVDFRITEGLTAFAEYNRFNTKIKKGDFDAGKVQNDSPKFDTARVGLSYMF